MADNQEISCIYHQDRKPQGYHKVLYNYVSFKMEYYL
jgi:hypothetical protein